MVEILQLTKQTKVEVWKTANHLDECRRQKRKLKTLGCFFIGVERILMRVWVCSWVHPRRRSRIFAQEAKFAQLKNSDFAWNQRHRWVHKNRNFKFDVEYQFILRRVIFTDEATFRMNGYVKKRNCHICIEKRPRDIYEHVRNFQKINVCCSIMQDNVMGPFVFVNKKTLSRQTFAWIYYKYLSLCEQMLLNNIRAKYYCKKTVTDYFNSEV
jgi:hypothetical protein